MKAPSFEELWQQLEAGLPINGPQPEGTLITLAWSDFKMACESSFDAGVDVGAQKATEPSTN